MTTPTEPAECHKYKTAEEALNEGKLNYKCKDLEKRTTLAKYRQEAHAYMNEHKDKIITGVIDEYVKSVGNYNSPDPPYTASADSKAYIKSPGKYYNAVCEIYYEESRSACANVESILNKLGYNIRGYENHIIKDKPTIDGFSFNHECSFK